MKIMQAVYIIIPTAAISTNRAIEAHRFNRNQICNTNMKNVYFYNVL